MLEQLTINFKALGTEKFEKIRTQIKAIKESISSPIKAVVSVAIKGKEKIESVKAKLNSLKAKISKPFKMLLNTNVVQKTLNSTKSAFKKFGKYATQQFEKAQKKANSFGGVVKRIIGALGAGLVIKSSIDGASSTEQYRNTLETVLKDPDKARQKLAWASRFANKTPFETDEVVGGMTKLQSYGIEGDRVLKTTKRTYLEMIGDMASGMGKSFDQAIEAVADAKTGELERLKEFGITKQMLSDFGNSKGIELFNNKGQIKDMELFNKTLFEMMDSRFGGAMEKQAKSFKGSISTIKGAFKSALASLAGINEFGDIIENSPFQILKDKVIIPLANWFVKKQEDGTFTKWSEKLAGAFSTIISIGEKVVGFMVKWKEIIIPLISAISGLFILNKIVVLIGAINTVLTALSFNPTVLAIGVVIAAGVLLYRNWDLVKEKMLSLWNKIVGFGKILWNFAKKIITTFSPLGVIVKLIVANWDSIKEKISQVASYIYSKIQDIGLFFIDLKNKTVDIFKSLIELLSEVLEKLKTTATSAFDFVLDYVEKIWDKIKSFFGNLGEKIKSLPGISIFFKKETEDTETAETANIDGSHKLGLSRVPFDGYIAELHEGERVLTKQENKSYSENSNNFQNNARNDKRYEIHIHVGQVGSEIDWSKVGELIRLEIEKKDIEKDIEAGVI